MDKRIYIALVHWPVKDKNGREINSAVTNLDIHDLSRLSRTFGLSGFFVVTRDNRQKDFVKAITRHWTDGFGASYNSDRKEALSGLKVTDTLESLKRELTAQNFKEPIFVSTCADRKYNSLSFSRLRDLIWNDCNDYVLIFGTGWGLSDTVFETSDYVLEPVDMKKGYNHLSVRSAASIVLDRLFN